MKKTILFFIAGAFLLAGTSCDKLSLGGSLKSEVDSASYALGIKYGENFKQIKQDIPDFNYELFAKGILEVVNEKETQIDPKDCEALIMAFAQKQQAQKLEKDSKEEVTFLESNKSKPGIITLESGLQYEIISEGTGASPKVLEDTVIVHYKGTFIDGKEFDNSYTRGTPFETPLAQTIQGWQEALPLMKVGSKFKLYVPAALAYRDRMMIFECELLGVKPAKAVKNVK